MNETYEVPERKEDEELPSPELKPLTWELKHTILDDTNKYPIIVSANLVVGEEEKYEGFD
jgi:hypothetical protein